MIHRTSSRRRGAEAVEFALICLPLFLGIMGMIELARAFMVSEMMNHASREGVRTATLKGKTYDDVVAAVNNAASPARISNVTTTVVVTSTSGTVTTPTNNSTFAAAALSGSSIKVTASVNYGNVTWLPFHWFVKSGAKLSTTASMQKE